MKMKLRDYQKKWCRAIDDAFKGKINETKFTKVLATAATGAGKSAMATALMAVRAREGQKSLFLCHTNELADQAIATVNRFSGIIPDLEKASSRASREAEIVVASVQSMVGRLGQWDPGHFGFCIHDECHIAMSDTSQKILNHFHSGGADILGITATAQRADKKSLMRFFEHLAAEIPMAELIRARHLSPIMVETVPLEIRIESKITDGDNDNVAAELEVYFDAIITAMEKHAGDRKKFLWFHPSVPASKKFTQMLITRGHSAAHVDGNSPDRKEVIEGFAQSRFTHLNNSQVLSTGYDQPDIDCVIILAPLKSRTAYIQRVGRGTRLFCPHGCHEWCDHPDRKSNCLLLDFLWSFADHDVMGPADLLTDAPEQRKALAKKLKEPGALDILSADEFVTSEREADLLEALKRNRGRRGSKVDALSFAALLHQPQLLDYEPLAQWHHLPVSPRQAEVLAEVGVDPESIQDRGHASALMDAVVARRTGGGATLKQVAALMRAGVENPHLYSFAEAGKKLDNIYQQH